MTLKRKIILIISLLLTISNLGLFIWITFFTINEFITQERYDLREICRGIEKIANNTILKNPQKKESLKNKIADTFLFLRTHKKISYIIKNKQGNTVINYNKCKENETSFKNARLRQNYKFKWKFSRLEYWDFKMLYQGKYFTIIIDRSNVHRSIVDKLLPVFFIASAIIIILSIVSSIIIIKRILKPVDEISKAATMIEEGNLDYQMKILNDNKIDELEQLKINLNKTFSSLKQSFSTISDFSSNVAHELRTPLTILLGNLEVGLRRTRTKEEYQEIINDAIITVKEMQHLIEDMLLMLKPVSAYDKKNFEKIELDFVLNDIIEQFEILATLKHITIKKDISQDLYIIGIPSLIKRIFINIIDNAIKFSPENTTIKIKLKKVRNKIEFTVSDEGPGIPENFIEQIFDRFVKGNTHTNSHGMGLAMTKQLTTVHNAQISVSNNKNKGVCFKISFNPVN